MMSKVTGFCFLVSCSVFLGRNFISAESNPTDDWKGMVERRLMYLEEELKIHKTYQRKTPGRERELAPRDKATSRPSLGMCF